MNKAEIVKLYKEIIAEHGLNPEDTVVAGDCALVMHGVIGRDELCTKMILELGDESLRALREKHNLQREDVAKGYSYVLRPNVLVTYKNFSGSNPEFHDGVAVKWPVKLLVELTYDPDFEETGVWQRLLAVVQGNLTLTERESRIKEAKDILFGYGSTINADHKTWAIDQAVRALAGETYHAEVSEREEDGYEWDIGCHPN